MLERAAWEEEEAAAEAVVAAGAPLPLILWLRDYNLDAHPVMVLIAFSFHLPRFGDFVRQLFHHEALIVLQEPLFLS